MKASYQRVRISPLKANIIAKIVRGQKAGTALNTLRFMPKKGARILYKVLKSAISNAENNFNQDAEKLIISRLIVNKGPFYKRHISISRGRVHPIRKKTSHILIDLQVAAESKELKKEFVKKEAVKTPSKSETKDNK